MLITNVLRNKKTSPCISMYRKRHLTMLAVLILGGGVINDVHFPLNYIQHFIIFYNEHFITSEKTLNFMLDCLLATTSTE